MAFKLYQKFDDAFMYGVNKTVKVYNWTTGRTKLDLSNKILIAGTIMAATECLLPDSPIPSFFAPFWVLLGHSYSKRHNEINRKEIDALEKEAKDLSVERQKDIMGVAGHSIGAIGTCGALSLSSENLINLDALGMAFFGLSEHFMRADYLPPQKNVVSRAYDSLKKKISEIDFTPVPEPVPIRSFSSQLEASL